MVSYTPAGISNETVLYKGVTTSDGSALKTTLIDSTLISTNDFITGTIIVILSGDCRHETRNISTFVSASGTITVGTAFSAKIISGVTFAIVAGVATDLSTIESKVDIVDTVVDGIQIDLDNATDGLGALKILIDANQIDLNTIIADTTIIKADTQTIEDSTLKASPTAGSLARFVASGGTALGTQLPDSKSLYDVIALDRLDNATYGLSALNTDLDTIDGLHDVPVADAATNTYMRDVVGNKSDDPIGAPNGTASVMAYIKALLGTGLVDGAKNIGFNRDLPYLTEFFTDETIDASVWDETITNSGTIAFTMESGYKFVRLSTGATNVSTSVLNTDQRFEFRPNSFNIISNAITRIVLEWDMRFTNVANILNTSFIAGFGNAKTSIRTSNNIAAICLNGDVLTAITDDAGTEALTDISAGITVTNWNKYRITAVPGNSVAFYINDTLVATHNVAAEIPDDVMYIVFHNANDAAADADVDVAHIRQWYSE